MSETNTTPAPKTPKVKVEKPLNVCWSGCGGMTRGRFVPGMDARFHGWAKKVARGELNYDTETGVVSQLDGTVISTLPHEESRESFESHVADERPKAALRAQELAQKQAGIAQRKLEREQAKAAKLAAKNQPKDETVGS